MADWHVSFVVRGAKFEPLMELLVPMGVQDLEYKIVAGTPKKIRAGDKPAWQVVTEGATDKPQPRAYFIELLKKAGFNNPSGFNNAVEKRAILVKMVKGEKHYVKGGKR